MRTQKIRLLLGLLLVTLSICVQAAPKIKICKIQASQFKFMPSTITVNKNDHVRMILTSTDVTHGFKLEAYDINTKIEKDKKTVINFVADKVGTFPFICSVYCGSGHRSMKGTLIVK